MVSTGLRQTFPLAWRVLATTNSPLLLFLCALETREGGDTVPGVLREDTA